VTLEGRTILITRPAEDSSGLATLLRERGANVIEAPTIEIAELDDPSELDAAVRRLAAGDFAWVTFTSPRAVDSVLARLRRFGLPPRLPAKVAAVGPATSARLADAGVEADLIADPHTSEALSEALPAGAGVVLLPRADIAPDGLEAALEAKGWTPVRVDAYRTLFPPRLPEEASEALRAGRVDAVTFTSASTVEGFRRIAELRDGVRVVCIGPVTAEAAERAGLAVAAVAEPHTVDGIVRALENLWS
jgi:uroporphyrinogen-III synthase